MNSIICIFQELYLDFKNVVLSPLPCLPPCIDSSPPPPTKFWRAAPPMRGAHPPIFIFSTFVGNPGMGSLGKNTDVNAGVFSRCHVWSYTFSTINQWPSWWCYLQYFSIYPDDLLSILITVYSTLAVIKFGFWT